jgi:hypothetical protein
MNNKRLYENHLRVIGQALETERVSVFELKCEMGRYVTNGTPDKPMSLVTALRQWRKLGWKSGSRTMRYTFQDLEELERQGKTRRVSPNRLPDFYNNSSMLRTLGAYLEAKNAELLEIQKRPMTVTLLYQNDGGHPKVEDRTIASFYNFFMEQYGKRARGGH